MRPFFTCSIQHTPWRPDRVEAYKDMKPELMSGIRTAYQVVDDRMTHSTTWAEFKTHLAMKQWTWALDYPDATHHVFMSDDLHLAPGFWGILEAMVSAKPDAVIGLLSNHPDALHYAR
jgi:hypothetical protein